jgi:hypothetical protein
MPQRHAARLAARIQANAAACRVPLEVWLRLSREQRKKKLTRSRKRESRKLEGRRG